MLVALFVNQITTPSGQSSFSDISLDKIQLLIKLRNVYGDKDFQMFYEVLSDSMMLINWLRENTRGMDRYYNYFVAIGNNYMVVEMFGNSDFL